jgi:hypothetical protein
MKPLNRGSVAREHNVVTMAAAIPRPIVLSVDDLFFADLDRVAHVPKISAAND